MPEGTGDNLILMFTVRGRLLALVLTKRGHGDCRMDRLNFRVPSFRHQRLPVSSPDGLHISISIIKASFTLAVGSKDGRAGRSDHTLVE